MVGKTGLLSFRSRTKNKPFRIRENTRHFDKTDYEHEDEDQFERKYREYAYANTAEELELDRQRRARLRHTYFRWNQYDQDE